MTLFHNPLRAVAMPEGAKGRILLSAMPGRDGAWERFLREARREQLTQVACLTPWHEVVSLAPAYATAIQQGLLPFRWLQLPMRNFGLADEAEEFRQGIEALARQVTAGDTVLLHCAAGIGRTGTAAACLLKTLGLPSDAALQRVRDAGSNPETATQGGLIDGF